MRNGYWFIGKIFIVFCLIFSIWMVETAPKIYSLQFCTQCATIYLLSMVIFCANCIYNRGYNGLCSVIFILAFFFTNYLYPLYFYANDAEMSIFAYDFTVRTICKGTAVATLGGVAFMLGCYDSNSNSRNGLIDRGVDIRPLQKIRSVEIMIVVLVAFIMFYNNIEAMVTRTYSATAQFEKKTASAYLKILYIFLYYLVFKDFCRISSQSHTFNDVIRYCCKPIHLAVALVVFMQLWIGGRTVAIGFFLQYALCYISYIQKIKPLVLLTGGVAIVILLFFVGQVRGRFDFDIANTLQVSSVLYYVQDLSINSRSLYELVEYADVNGATMGKTMLLDIASFIPFGQSLLLSITGLTLTDVSSPYLVTYMYFGDHPEIGLGTNLIGDIYVSFKAFGVFILMYLFGCVMRVVSARAKYSVIYMLVLVMMSTNIIFITRNGYFSIWRNVLWGLVLYYFDKYLYNAHRNL